ncbi:MAG: tRNA (adenosine(37)-N6)-threonylcarbamoyltransferase complex dimerization subunit type 1 TsaB [Ignavibacteriaceae bacterium]|nr:tRNA (adenosine(37)-N6)-threonylcarbamoyltransferase complex dimerization subunit type 1 TsaB [Ignavibacteriaceae bacterium]
MNNELPILSIETTGIVCSACIYFSEEKFYEMSVSLKNSHSEKVFEIIEKILTTSKLNLKELGAIAVSSGPGSFTGLRIGMSAAKGIAVGAGLKIIPVPTFNAIAFQVSEILPVNTQFVIANKVNKDELYFAKFKIIPEGFIFTEELKIINATVAEEYSEGCLKFGNYFGNKFSTPSAMFVAKWAEKFGRNLAISDFDYLEPLYLKNFVIKEKKYD